MPTWTPEKVTTILSQVRLSFLPPRLTLSFPFLPVFPFHSRPSLKPLTLFLLSFPFIAMSLVKDDCSLYSSLILSYFL